MYADTLLYPDTDTERQVPSDTHIYQVDLCGKATDICPLRFITIQRGGTIRWGEHGKKYFFDPDNPGQKPRRKIWQYDRVVQHSLMDTGANKHPCKVRACAGKEISLKTNPDTC